MIPTPYLALGVALAVAGAGLGGYSHGKKVANGEHARKENAALVAAEKGRIAAERRIGVLEQQNTALERQRQTAVREVYREIPRIIQADPSLYGRMCLDDGGVRALDRARASAVGGDPGAPAGQAQPGGRAGDSANRGSRNGQVRQ